MGAVLRYDLGDLEPPRFHANGTVTVDARITRSGVFEYTRADGSIRREYRSPKVVFGTMEKFVGQIVTDDHPRDDTGKPIWITADNAKEHQRGMSIGAVRRDGNYVRATLKITDKGLIEKMRAGKNQISNGYSIEVSETPGVSPEGERYDAEQVEIVDANHIAVVEKARAGAGAIARMDGALVASADEPINPRRDAVEEKRMKIRIDGVEYEVTEQVAQAIDKLRADATEQLTKQGLELAAAKQQIETLAVSAGSLKTKLDAAEKTIADMPQAIAARTSLEAEARTHLGAEAKFDGKTDGQVRAMVVEKLTAVKLDSASDEAYRVALAGAGNDNPALANARQDAATGAARTDRSADLATYQNRYLNAGKPKQKVS